MVRYLYSEIANTIGAYKRCIESGNTEWKHRHEDYLKWIEKNLLPSGSGIDSGTSIELDASHQEKIVLHTIYYHMNDGGMYDGWTEHKVIVTPSFLGGMHLRITGRNRNDIKEYLGDEFHIALCADVTLEWYQYHFEGVPSWQGHYDNVTGRTSYTVMCGNTPIATCGTLDEMRAFIVRWCEENKASLKPRGL